MIQFYDIPEFKKDLKKLIKKYRTLDDDLEVVKKVLQENPDARLPFSYEIDDLSLETCIIKVKKIASKSFKGKGVQSGFRLIYAYFEFVKKIVFIELYHKSQKENEDNVRIKNNFK